MIERWQLTHPGWRFGAPAWMRRLRPAESVQPRRAKEVSREERAAMRAATTHRASGIRIDAERHLSGLTTR